MRQDITTIHPEHIEFKRVNNNYYGAPRWALDLGGFSYLNPLIIPVTSYYLQSIKIEGADAITIKYRETPAGRIRILLILINDIHGNPRTVYKF